MTSFIPQLVPIQRWDNDEIVEVYDITIIAWASAAKLEAETGLKAGGGGRTATAIIKDTLGLPKNMKKVEVAAICNDLKDQLMQAREDAERWHDDGQV